jgi:GAF domain-containing protein
LPLRLRNEQIGALNLFRARPGLMDATDLEAAQALADVAAIGLLQHRAGQDARLLAEQLSYALNNRVTIEQAKGFLAERLQVKVDEAFELLRGYARARRLRVTDVAIRVLDTLPAEDLRRSDGADRWPEDASGRMS